MVIGIMGAMPEEVDQLCARLSEVTVEEYGGVCYHRGSLAGRQAVVCCAGMGKANAAATTQVLITKYGAEKIIFSGVAGNMTSKIGIGDVVIGQTVLYHDADMDMLDQNPPYLDEYPGDPALIAAAQAACAQAGVKAIAGRIATGDRFVGGAAVRTGEWLFWGRTVPARALTRSSSSIVTFSASLMRWVSCMVSRCSPMSSLTYSR